MGGKSAVAAAIRALIIVGWTDLLRLCLRRGRRDDAWTWLALGDPRLAVGTWQDRRLAGLCSGLRFCRSWRGRDGQQFVIEGNRAGKRSGRHPDDGAQRVAGLAGDFEDFKAAFRAIGIDRDAFLGFFLIEQGDTVSAGDGRNPTEGIVFERIGNGAFLGWRRFGGER